MTVPVSGLALIRWTERLPIPLIRQPERKRYFLSQALVRQAETMNVYHYPLEKPVPRLLARRERVESERREQSRMHPASPINNRQGRARQPEKNVTQL